MARNSKYIAWDARICTGCRLCEAVCSMERDEGISPDSAAIRVGESRIAVCRQCKAPACKDACSTGAMGDDGPSDQCTGCGLCLAACPHDALFQTRPGTRPIRCNRCGGDPRCVAFCPTGALTLMGKSSWAAFRRRVALTRTRWATEIGLWLKTRSNLMLLRMARKRIVRVREGRPDTLLDRLVLSPMVKPFEKSFPSMQEKK